MQRSITSLVMLRWEGSSAFTSGPPISSTSSHSVGGGISEKAVDVQSEGLVGDGPPHQQFSVIAVDYIISNALLLFLMYFLFPYW